MSPVSIDQADGTATEAPAQAAPVAPLTNALREELRGHLAHFGGLSLDIEAMVAERDRVKARIAELANEIKAKVGA